MPLNTPWGSTLQLDVGRGLLCLATLVTTLLPCVLTHAANYTTVWNCPCSKHNYTVEAIVVCNHSLCIQRHKMLFVTDPRKSDTADGIRKHVSENGRIRVASWKVGVEPWMLPMCYLCEQAFKRLRWFQLHLISITDSAHEKYTQYTEKHYECKKIKKLNKLKKSLKTYNVRSLQQTAPTFE